MAKEKKTEEATDEAPPKSKKMLFIIIGLVVLLGGGGAGAYLMMGGGEQDAEAAAEAKALADTEAKEAAVVNMSLDPFIVNLADPGGSHYLKTTITLELNKQAGADWISSRLPRVRDAILMLLSSKESSELLTSRGKFTLRDEILAEVNGMMQKGETQAIYLTEFVVQ